jgi:hypothetical protein
MVDCVVYGAIKNRHSAINNESKITKRESKIDESNDNERRAFRPACKSGVWSRRDEAGRESPATWQLAGEERSPGNRE